ncbi:hypothetical protein AAG906_020345 [Vitis piasezkii]
MSCAICQSFEHLVEECPILPAAREMFGMPCGICQSFEHLVEECPIIPVAREIFELAQAPQEASNLEQAMMNLNKVMEDFVEAKKSIIDQVGQEIDSQDRKMDGRLNDLSQKTDNLEYTSSRSANLNAMQEKENFPFQPYKNQKGIHEIEVGKSDKEVDLPACKLEHEVKNETEKEKREEIKGKKKGKSIEKDDYIDEEPQKIESIASNSAQFGVEMKNLWPFEDDSESSASNSSRFGFETKKLWPFERIHFLLHPYPPQSQASEPHFFAPLCLRPEEAMPQLPKAVREPRTPWDHTHEASHSISDLLKPSKPIENTKIEAKVLIQPTQKATTDASAPQDLTIFYHLFTFCLYMLY